mmetsp:Transcript_16822/g.43200  ORF Transcript_16822/g.43200 Transcript_16822/m.43200 type:complete len:231 (-) Transcript_16822:122-814(-)
MLSPSSLFTKDSIARHLAAGHSITVRRDEQHWCCLICLRQFKSKPQAQRHVEGSALHARNLAEAVIAGQVPSTASTAANDAQPTKRDRPAVDIASSGAGGSLSALEQMELFEKRLKGQAKRVERDYKLEESEVDSNHARTINKQMDWECSGCTAFNFARVVVCFQCKKHVDSTTRYLSNRLKEIKQQRFATAFQDDQTLSRFAPVVPPPQQARSDGSFGDGVHRCASFQL